VEDVGELEQVAKGKEVQKALPVANIRKMGQGVGG